MVSHRIYRSDFMEAPPRIELGNKGFADLCLTAWLWCRNCISYFISISDIRKNVNTLLSGNAVGEQIKMLIDKR